MNVRQHCAACGVALQFLTQIPVRFKRYPDAQTQGLAPLYYPLVGLLLGSALLAFSILFSNLGANVQAALLILFWVCVTGALHIDGLADCADGWLGGQGSKERTLAIMKDPQVGASGATAIALLVLLKWTALASLLEQPLALELLWVPLIARAAGAGLLATTAYVSHSGIASPWLQAMPRIRVSLLCVLLLAGLAVSYPIVAFMVLALFWLVRRIFCQRLGGITGDVAGALIELTEVTILIGLLLSLQA